MANYTLNNQGYWKLLLHAARFPDKGVNGLLLGKASSDGVSVTDAIPLFHQHTLAPMLESATMLVTSCKALTSSLSICKALSVCYHCAGGAILCGKWGGGADRRILSCKRAK
jgi:hypothetical protein